MISSFLLIDIIGSDFTCCQVFQTLLDGSMIKGYKILMFIPVRLLITRSGQAGVYRYVDEQGRLHFTNVPTTNKYRLYRSEGEPSRLETLISHFAQKFQLDRSLIKAVIKKPRKKLGLKTPSILQKLSMVDHFICVKCLILLIKILIMHLRLIMPVRALCVNMVVFPLMKRLRIMSGESNSTLTFIPDQRISSDG